ncbi:MAG TPA: hypothetical protein EYP08_03750 [Pyrodictiaceae archaeon]|nr:hypothetical protein [Pyrodictiaceae archaeon]HIP85010.1 hypothetical protein [Pyrodictium sp.]
MVEEKVLDFTNVTGACGDLSVVFESIAERMQPGNILVVKARDDQIEEVKDSLEMVSNYFEVIEEKKVDDNVYEIRLRRK